MDKKKVVSVTHRPKGNTKALHELNKEPEMIELKRMVRDGELDSERTIKHIRTTQKKEKNQ